MAMKVRKSERFDAVKKFTNREKPRKVFWDAYKNYKESINDDPDVKVIVYYGLGGIGKTRLLNQLQDELIQMDEENSRFVMLDFAEQSGSNGLAHLVKALKHKYDFRFPLYTIGLARKFELNQNGENIDEEEKENFFGDTTDDLCDLIGVLEYIPFIDVLPKAVRMIGKSANFAKKQLDKHKYQERIEEINTKSKEDIDKFLTKLFVEDVNENMSNSKEPLVIFLDTYENLVNEFSTEGESTERDRWLRGLENGLILNMPKTIWVIAGRERLKWADMNPNWEGSLDQHVMGSISERDATEYFEAAGLPFDLHNKLYEKTAGVPLLLDLSVDTYYRLKDEGDGRELDIDNYGNDTSSIVERYVRYMNGTQQEILYKMAFLRKWPNDNKNIFEHGKSNFDKESFYVLNNSSIVRFVGEGCILQGIVADILREKGRSTEKRELCREYLSDLIDYFRTNIPNAKKGKETEYLLPAAVNIALEYYEGEERSKFLREVVWHKLDDFTSNIDQSVVNICECIYNELHQRIGENNEDTITAMKYLWQSLSFSGQYQAAFNLAKKGLELCGHLLGEKSPLTLAFLENLAKSYHDVGDLQSTIALQIKVFELRKNIFGKDHPETISAMNNLALSYRDVGDFQRSLKINKEVFEWRRNNLGKDHLDTLSAMNNLSLSCQAVGDFQHALDIQKEVFEKRKEILGINHPDTIVALHNLALSYQKLGDFQRALEMKKDVFELFSTALGKDHPYTIRAMNNLATSYQDVGDFQSALNIQKEVLEKRKKILGEKHPHTIESLGNLALSYLRSGNLRHGFEMQKEVFELFKNTLGENHPNTIASLNTLAICYRASGDFQHAFEIQKDVYERSRKVLGEKHPLTIKSLMTLQKDEKALLF